MGYNAGMNEKYQLVFRGEIAEGQHRAVVKRRLSEALKLNDAQAEKLFAEQAVVLKKSTDAKTAAALQALFKKAGARLRVHPLDASGARVAAPAKPAQQAEPEAATSDSRETVREGAAAGRAEVTSARVPAPEAGAEDTANAAFTLQSRKEIEVLVAALKNEKFEFDAPDFPLAQPGVDLSEPRQVEAIQLPELDFTVAEPGADLLIEKTRPEPVEVGELNFEVAEVGATIGDDSPKPVPPAPDTSHLKIAGEV